MDTNSDLISSICSDILDAAYEIYEEFGPDMRIPRIQRLKDAFPDLQPTDIDELLEQMKLVTETVWKLAERGGEAKIKKEEILDVLQTEHPFLTDVGLNRARFLINYYAWHEGYC